MPLDLPAPPRGDNHQLSIRYVPVDSLKPLDGNPRTYSRSDRRRAKRILKRFRLSLPLVIDLDHHVIVGELLLLVATELGLTEVPTVYATGLSALDLQAMSVAYNRLGETGEWDQAALGNWILQFEDGMIDFDPGDIGLEVAEVDLAIASADDGQLEERPFEQGPHVSLLGDLYLLGKARLLVGDATREDHVARLMNGCHAAMLFADPPYNVKINGHVSSADRHSEFEMASGEMSPDQFTGFLRQFIELAVRFSIGGAVHYICMDWRHMRELLDAAHSHYGAHLNVCVWVKDRQGQGSWYRSQHEFVFAFRVGKERQLNNVQLGRFGRSRTNVWPYPSAATFLKQDEDGALQKGHPTPKPVKLVADAILDCTKRGDIVLDPFLGSGTTLIAAERVGRICYGVELDPQYADLSIRRWQSWTGQDAIHEETGLTFNELAKLRLGEVGHG